jgi:hypothetical protein
MGSDPMEGAEASSTESGSRPFFSEKVAKKKISTTTEVIAEKSHIARQS